MWGSLAAFFVGIGAAFLHDHFFSAAVPTSSEGNWGLSFQTEWDPLGAEQILHFTVDGQDFVLRTPNKAACHAGDRIRITWDSRCMHVFSQVSGQALLHGARTEMT